MLGGPFSKTLRDQARAAVGWGLGFAFLIGITVAFWPAVETSPALSEWTDDLPESLQAIVGTEIGSPAGYINSQLFTFMLPVLVAVLAIGKSAATLAGEETSGHLELLLAQPISRRRLALGKIAGVLVTVAGLVAASWLFLVVGALMVGLELDHTDVALAYLALALLGFVFAAFAYAAGCLTGRRGPTIAIAAVAASGFYLLNAFAPLVDALEPLRYLSPWNWAFRADALAQGPTVLGLLALIALAAVLIAAGTRAFEARDINGP